MMDLSGIEQESIAVSGSSNAWALRRERDTRIALNSLCQKLDRVLSGDDKLYVTDTTVTVGATDLKQSHVMLNHSIMADWSVKGSRRDRLALTLALNMHELSHVIDTPRVSNSEVIRAGPQLMQVLNVLEDQRIELLMSVRYPKSRDYFRLLNARAIKQRAHAITSDMFVLYYGRRHLFPSKLNSMFEQAFNTEFTGYIEPGVTHTLYVQRLIDEYVTLDTATATGYVRAWNIVRAVAPYFQTHSPIVCSGIPMRGKTGDGKANENLRARAKSVLSKADKASTGRGVAESLDAESKPADSGEAKGDAGDDGDEAQETDEGDTDGDEPGTGASHDGKSSGKIRVGESLGLSDILDDIEDDALDNLDADLDNKQRAYDAATHNSQDISNSTGHPDTLRLPGELQQDSAMLARLFRGINLDMGLQDFRNLRRGRLDTRRVATCVASGSNRMFKHRQPDLSKNAAMGIHVTFDVSGSMSNGGKDKKAMDAACTIAQAAELAGHMSRLSVFGSHCMNVKGWQQKVYHGMVDAGGGTNPLPVLLESRGDFRRLALVEKVRNHVLFIVTDGGFDDPIRCHQAVTDLIHDGVYVVLVGIDTPAQVIPGVFANVTVKNAAQLADVLREHLKRLATVIHRDTRTKLGLT